MHAIFGCDVCASVAGVGEFAGGGERCCLGQGRDGQAYLVGEGDEAAVVVALWCHCCVIGGWWLENRCLLSGLVDFNYSVRLCLRE